MKGIAMETTHAVLPAGEYPVRVTQVEDANGPFGAYVRLALEVAEGAHVGARLVACAHASLDTRSKLARWSAAFGYPWSPGHSVDTARLVGTTGIATVTHKAKNDGSVAAVVSDIRPEPSPFEPERDR